MFPRDTNTGVLDVNWHVAIHRPVNVNGDLTTIGGLLDRVHDQMREF